MSACSSPAFSSNLAVSARTFCPHTDRSVRKHCSVALLCNMEESGVSCDLVTGENMSRKMRIKGSIMHVSKKDKGYEWIIDECRLTVAQSSRRKKGGRERQPSSPFNTYWELPKSLWLTWKIGFPPYQLQKKSFQLKYSKVSPVEQSFFLYTGI